MEAVKEVVGGKKLINLDKLSVEKSEARIKSGRDGANKR